MLARLCWCCDTRGYEAHLGTSQQRYCSSVLLAQSRELDFSFPSLLQGRLVTHKLGVALQVVDDALQPLHLLLQRLLLRRQPRCAPQLRIEALHFLFVLRVLLLYRQPVCMLRSLGILLGLQQLDAQLLNTRLGVP